MPIALTFQNAFFTQLLSLVLFLLFVWGFFLIWFLKDCLLASEKGFLLK